ncbi:MAG: tyrosine-type recombinase/integrase [Methanobrevibacter sp.]|nr:tyrosine-type recombinase/integrase [Methanosphaera sp.]MBR0369270.1 tyrosine-type recombinase/integrase [Methanobrevibacter sp.]
MDFTREKLNELLYYMQVDNPKYGLISKILYVYGRKVKEVFNLQKQDINFKDKEITFNINDTLYDYPLIDELSELLEDYIQTNNILVDEEYLFRREDETMAMATKKLNYYLEKTIKSINRTLDLDYPRITTNDLRLLRGKHLVLDGADLHVVNELYNNINITLTRKYLDYDELLKQKFPCNDLRSVFEDCTDLNLFHDDRFEDTSIFTVSSEHNSTVIEIDYTMDAVHIISDEDDPLILEIQEIPVNVLINNLSRLKPGDYKYLAGLRFIKN